MTALTKHRLLLIGSGGYIQQTVLPALTVLAQQYELIGLVNRSGNKPDGLQAMAPELKVDKQIDCFDLANTDIIFVCIPPEALPALLKQLAHLPTEHITLVVTTPVFNISDSHFCSLFSSFKQVLAFENAFCLPPFIAAQKLLSQDKIGQLKKINLNHSGFRYHALALIRSLYKGKQLLHGRSIAFGRYQEYNFKFSDKCYASIVEPRDYDAGSFMLAGTKGIICDYPLNAHNVYVISYQQNNQGLFTGLLINGQLQQANALDKLFKEKLPYASLPDNSLFRQLHIRGAVEVFNALHQDNLDYLYQHNETLYESFLLRIMQRLGFWFEPLAIFRLPLIKWAYIKLWPRLKATQSSIFRHKL
ncbi:MAG: hypothetical protein ACI9FJ_003114 [Alteromonadaceae bacterium]|jgi:hypothetical protein